MRDLDLYAKIEPMIGFYEEYEELYQLYLGLLNDLGVKKILDIGCGNGNFLTHLKDFKASGIDISPQMTKICQEKGLQVECKSIDDVEDSFDMITAIADVLNYMDSDKLSSFLSQIPKKLEEKGYFICDINTPYGFSEVASGVMVSEDESGFLAVDADFIEDELKTDFTFFEKREDEYKKHQWSITQYSYEVSDIVQELDMKLLKVVDINLFSEELPDKSLLIFQKL